MINNISSIKNEIRLCLFGGEPTLHPDIYDITKNLNNKKINIELQTNLSLHSDLLTKLIKTRNISDFNVSLHYGIVNKNLFKQNVVILFKYQQAYKYNIVINLMYEREYHDEILTDYKLYNNLMRKMKLKNSNVGVSLVYHKRANEIKDEYNEKEIEMSHNSYNHSNIYVEYENGKHEWDTFFRLKGKGQYNFKGYICECVNKNLYIDSNGDLYPCQTYYRYLKEKIGNVNDENIFEKIKSTKYIICKSSFCDCEIKIPKWKNVNEYKKQEIT